MPEPVTITVRPYQPGDEHAILAAFNRVFARVDAHFVPRTLAHWHWLYRDNPAGLRIVIALDASGHVLAQYAGLPVRARLDGQPVLFCQSIDSLSTRGETGGLSRRGAFVACGEAFRDLYGGVEPPRHAFIYGLPIRPAWRIGKSSLSYELLREGHLLVAPIRGLRAEPAPGIEIEEVDRFPPEVDGLFERASRGEGAPGALVVRDARYLNWRFADHPVHRYRFALARDARGLAGLSVYRTGTLQGFSGVLVCDWLVPADDERSTAALLAFVGRAARVEGAVSVVALFHPRCAEWLLFQRAGFRVQRAANLWAAHSHDKRFTLSWFAKSFYATLGDTDLV